MSRSDTARKPLVSFVVPTRNSARTLHACLTSLKSQSGVPSEIIVIDNHSDDATPLIGQQLSDQFETRGPERSAQRNAGARLAQGEFVVFIDSDMTLEPTAARDIANCFQSDGKLEGLVIPEYVEGSGLLERARSIEKRAYLNDPTVEAARAFRHSTFVELGGYDETMTGGEDWDLPDRVARDGGKIDRIESRVFHDESGLTLRDAFSKKFYYGKQMSQFVNAHKDTVSERVVRTSAMRRIAPRIFKEPLATTALFVLKAVEAAGIGTGLIFGRVKSRRSNLARQDLSNARVLIASHEGFEGGTAHALEEYLSTRTKELTILLEPFGEAPEKRIGLRSYDSGRQVTSKRMQFMSRVDNEFVKLLRDTIVLGRLLLMKGRRVDLFVGVDPFNAAIGLLARKLRLTKSKVVLYTIDFSPTRFANPFVNRVYHAIDTYCASKADVVWNVSSGIHEGRQSIAQNASWAPHLVVPVGVEHVVEAAQTQRHERLVFIGHLLEKQGLQFAIAALPQLLEARPGLRLVVVGTGAYRAELEQLTRGLGVENAVDFLGYVEDHTEAFRIVAKGGIALAPYTQDPESFTRFADPGKLKVYMAAALPIVMSDVPINATQLRDEGCALVVAPNGAAIADAVESFLSSDESFARASANALRMSQPFTWHNIFDQAFQQTTFVNNER